MHERTEVRDVCREEGGSDGESGEEGPELVPYEGFRLAPKIAVELIHAWRWPLTREEKAKELYTVIPSDLFENASRELENEENALNLKKLVFLEEALKAGTALGPNVFDAFMHESSALQSMPNWTLDNTDLMEQEREAVSTLLGLGPLSRIDTDLMEQDREAVSTLLGLGPLSRIDVDPMLSCMEEAEYFVKYANRSHLHNEWVNESTLMAFAKRKLTQFKRRHCARPVDMFNKEWAKPERMISRRKSRTGPGWELLIKWHDLGYEDCTWEAETAGILNSPEAVMLYIDLWKRQNNAVKKKSKSAQALFHETRKQQFANYKPVSS